MNTFKTALIIENEYTGRRRNYKFDTFEIAYRVYRKLDRRLYKVTFVKCN